MLISLFSLLMACDGGDTPDDAHAPAAAPAAHAPAAAPPPAAAPTPAPAAAASNGKLPGYSGRFADGKPLTAADVARVSPSEYRILRNEVFAQYGRAFKSEDLQQHFGATGWYKVNDSYTDDLLSPVDQKNVALIKSFEGDAAKAKAIQRGQYTQGDSALQIYGEGNAELVDMSGDIYNWDRQPRNWQALGDWVVTWEGPSTWSPGDPSVKNAQLWKLNHSAGEVVSVTSL